MHHLAINLAKFIVTRIFDYMQGYVHLTFHARRTSHPGKSICIILRGPDLVGQSNDHSPYYLLALKPFYLKLGITTRDCSPTEHMGLVHWTRFETGERSVSFLFRNLSQPASQAVSYPSGALCVKVDPFLLFF